jgi:hypothetical protein
MPPDVSTIQLFRYGLFLVCGFQTSADFIPNSTSNFALIKLGTKMFFTKIEFHSKLESRLLGWPDIYEIEDCFG